MQIVGGNVNVMDSEGVIIASGARERLGQVHAGALLAISRGDSVEIDADLARQLDGVRPGVNLVLRTDGRVVGCVGLSGDPRSVRVHAELVRLAAEAILEQSQLQNSLARDARQKEELVLALVRHEALTPELARWADRLRIDVRTARVAAVIEVDAHDLSDDKAVAEIQRLHGLLGAPDKGNLIATLSLNELLVLMPALNRKSEWDLAGHRRRAEQLIAQMREISPLKLRMGLGRYFSDHSGLLHSFETAKATLKTGKALEPEGGLYVFEDRLLAVLLSGFRGGWQAQELASPLVKLEAKDRR
ncbi:hypothetical protein LTR94_025614, partial [Friedmanniomyces endolithicus]